MWEAEGILKQAHRDLVGAHTDLDKVENKKYFDVCQHSYDAL